MLLEYAGRQMILRKQQAQGHQGTMFLRALYLCDEIFRYRMMHNNRARALFWLEQESRR